MTTILLLTLVAVFGVTGVLTFSTGNSSRNYTREVGTGLLIVAAGFLLMVPSVPLITVLGIAGVGFGGYKLYGVYRKKTQGEITS